jgi:hypothetical protein
MMRNASGPDSIYQLKISLQDIEPEVWRRILVSGSTNLYRLHHIIQRTMGWNGSHLHLFKAGGVRYMQPSPGFDLEPGDRDESKCQIADVLPAADTICLYVYDMGDDWRHEIVVENIRDLDSDTTLDIEIPMCLAGERACPPEDCGGPWGYENLLETLNDPEDPEHDDMLEWAGGNFDPEALDIDSINRALAVSRPGRRGKRAQPAAATINRPLKIPEGSQPLAFTPRQGQYLSFIYYYSKINGIPPAEVDIAQFFEISPPTAHQMLKTLESRGLVSRLAGQPRSVRVLVPRAALPELEQTRIGVRGAWQGADRAP